MYIDLKKSIPQKKTAQTDPKKVFALQKFQDFQEKTAPKIMYA